MTTPKPLSPAAQTVWDAFRLTIHSRIALANALRAAALFDHEKLLAIATELEGHHG